MKKLFSFAALALLLCVAACKQSGYKVTGTATGAEDGDTVILAIIHSMFEVDTLQTTVIKNGKFVFEGVQDTAAMRYIIWKSNSNPDLAVGTQFALENANIEIQLDTTPNTVAIISGTPANEELTDLAIHEAETSNKARPIFDVLNNPDSDEAAKAEAEKKLEELQQQDIEIYKGFIQRNINNIAGQTYLIGYAGMLDDAFVIEQLAALPDGADTEEIKSMRELYAKKAETAIGNAYKDIKAQTPEGEELSVSEVAEQCKVLMIDFWASWCGPCRAEMPHVKAAYDAYHILGFDIIGVSLDKDADAWKKAIEDLDLPWPQISDLKGWECEGAATYAVRSIPASVLVKDGKIVARDLRGSALADKVKELLAE